MARWLRQDATMIVLKQSRLALHDGEAVDQGRQTMAAKAALARGASTVRKKAARRVAGVVESGGASLRTWFRTERATRWSSGLAPCRVTLVSQNESAAQHETLHHHSPRSSGHLFIASMLPRLGKYRHSFSDCVAEAVES